MLRDSATEGPAHLSLFGGEGTGKSSLLNGTVDLACNRGLLAVKLALTPATVLTEIDFYQALYDATLQTLLDIGKLASEDPLMHTWKLRTYIGTSPSTPQELEHGELELGLLIAAKLNGRMVESVPIPLVRRDLERLLGIGDERMQRFVLCLDSAERVDENNDLAPSLTQLADSASFLTIVTAAEQAGSLQAAAPRAWAQIEVGPYRELGDVLDAITKPAKDTNGTPDVRPPTPALARDIANLTGRVPYEVNLVCHFIWNAIQAGEQEAFDLSPKVIQRVNAELEEKGRHQVSPEIATYSMLSPADYAAVVQFAPYEALTIRELALLRLMLADYDHDDLDQAETQIRLELAQLQQKGVVSLDDERFEINGSRDARLYLKYAAKRHTGDNLRYGQTYPWAVTTRCVRHLGGALVGEAYNEALIFSGGRPQEVGDSTAGSWLDAISQAATTRDIVELSEHFGLWLAPDQLIKNAESSLLLTVTQLQVGLYDVEHVDLILNTQNRSHEDATEAGEQWVAEAEELLAKYDVRIVGWRCYEVPSETARAAAAYGHLRLACGASYPVFRTGARDAAENLLASVVEIAEELIGSDPPDPLLRTQLANALSRHGFMAATRHDWNTAIEQFQRSRTMFLTEEWLLDYNEAYVHACQGRLDLACSLTVSAVEHHTGLVNQVLLHAYFPTPEDWPSPGDSWTLVELRGVWIKRFLDLQLVVFSAVAATERRKELESALDELGGSAPAPLLRLAGWARLTILNDADGAVSLFTRAVAATRYDEAQVPRQEANYAEVLTNPSSKTSAHGSTP
jgi:hypothetical protein